MGKLAELVLAIHNFLMDKSKNKKIVVVLTGGYATGKTTIGLILEKFFKNIIFINSDNFRRKIILGKNKKKNYKKLITSYKISLIRKKIVSFLNKQECKEKILLLEMPFIFDKRFTGLPIDYIIELESSYKDMEVRMSSRYFRKFDKERFKELSCIYEGFKNMSGKKSDILLKN